MEWGTHMGYVAYEEGCWQIADDPNLCHWPRTTHDGCPECMDPYATIALPSDPWYKLSPSCHQDSCLVPSSEAAERAPHPS